MGCTSEIQMRFTRERHARWAMHVAEDMIRLIYAPKELSWVREAGKCPSLSRRYLAFRQEAAALDMNMRGTAMEWLRRDRTMLSIERCQDISGWSGIECTEDFFPQLCYAVALRFPQAPFTACYRYEMTVSGAIQLIRMRYDGAVMHAQEMCGERPMDEDDWSGRPTFDYAALDGEFRMLRMTDPAGDVKEIRSMDTMRTLWLIQRRCRPLLVGMGGAACGLGALETDAPLRGIFLNPPEEWIGLEPEQERFRIEGSDVMLYGLRTAMNLLLACDPDALELLGWRKEQILLCTEEGQRILDNAPAFFSQRAIFSFNNRTVQLRRDIRHRIAEGRADKKELAGEMAQLIRIYAMGIELLVNGCVAAYRVSERTLLADILGGKYQDRKGLPTEAFDRLAEEYRGAFNGAAIGTWLPMEPDSDRVNALMMEIVHGSL